jgi:hypothetical protein
VEVRGQVDRWRPRTATSPTICYLPHEPRPGRVTCAAEGRLLASALPQLDQPAVAAPTPGTGGRRLSGRPVVFSKLGGLNLRSLLNKAISRCFLGVI